MVTEKMRPSINKDTLFSNKTIIRSCTFILEDPVSTVHILLQNLVPVSIVSIVI